MPYTSKPDVARNTKGAFPVSRLSYDIQLLPGNGLVSAPPYSFASDPDTGLFLPAVGEVSLVAAGTTRVRAHAAGVSVTGELAVSGSASVRGVDYTWPVANSDGVLTNDGAGELTWQPASGSSDSGLVFMLMGA